MTATLVHEASGAETSVTDAADAEGGSTPTFDALPPSSPPPAVRNARPRSERRPLPDRRPRAHWIAALLGVLMLVLLVIAERQDAPTADEPLHLVRGVAIFQTGDTRLSYAHPPLANLITGIPAWLSGPVRDVEEGSGWGPADALPASHSYFGKDYGRARWHLRMGRFVMMAWTLALFALVYLQAQRRFGSRVALWTAALLCSHPILIAHGHLVTTDLPLAFAAWVAVFAALHTVEHKGAWALLPLAGGCALMATVKHTGLLLCVILGACVLLLAALDMAPRWQGQSMTRRLLGAAGAVASAAALTVLAIDVVYLFNDVGLTPQALIDAPEPKSWLSKRAKGGLLGEGHAIGKLPPWFPVPLPFDWLAGLATVSQQQRQGHGSYFLGMRVVGHPAYFPVLLLAKSPAVWAIGLLISPLVLRSAARVRRESGPKPEHDADDADDLAVLLAHTTGMGASARKRAVVLIACFALAFLALSLRSRINIGVRHVLPLVPFGALALGGLAQRSWSTLTGSWSRAFVLGAVALCVLEGGAAAPNSIGYFNTLVGGDRGGQAISIIGEDWGQDVDDLGRWAKNHSDKPLYYSVKFPLRVRELARLGVTAKKLRCRQPPRGAGYVALHTTDVLREGKKCLRWLDLEHRSPVLDLHGRLRVYEVP